MTIKMHIHAGGTVEHSALKIKVKLALERPRRSRREADV
jgi:hypothetical protein